MAWLLPTHGPVFWEELRRRLRGGRGYIVLFAYSLVLMGLLLAVSYLAGVSDDPRQWSEFGARLWKILFIAQFIFVVLISPGVAATAVSAEREAGTLEHLFLTPLSTLAFILGKFFGAVGQLLVMILAGLPVVAVVFIYGGVDPKEMLTGYALILATGLLYAGFGFLASCLFARTTLAVVWAYGFMLMALVGAPTLVIVLSIVSSQMMFGDVNWVYGFCPPLYLLVNTDLVVNVKQILCNMLLLTGLTLGVCVVRIRRLRGVGPFIYRRISLEAARRASHPPVAP